MLTEKKKVKKVGEITPKKVKPKVKTLGKTKGSQQSFFELSKDLCGVIEADEDLSSNKKHLANYGK
ncbi:MAG: hypothetical protein SFU91_03500 [Chloroherpetonaceae bacterium]|nr:hypothetical protein [Chloroherpetonaceae bacterium]